MSPGLARREGHAPAVRPFLLSLRYLIVFQALLVAPVLVWAEPITHLLLGAGYGRSADVLRALTPYVYMSGLAALVAGAVNYLGEARRRVPYAIGDVVVGTALTVAALPTIGLLGAAYIADVFSVVYVSFHIWIARKFIDLPLRPLYLAVVRGLLAAAAMAGVLLAFGTQHLSPIDWIAGGALGLAAFAAVIVATGEVTLAELAALPGYVRRRFAR